MRTIIVVLMIVFALSFIGASVDIIREYARQRALRRRLENELNQVAKNNLKKLKENEDTRSK